MSGRGRAHDRADAAPTGGEGPRDHGFDSHTRAAPIVAWPAEDHGLGRTHAKAMVHVLTTGDQISGKHVNSGGTHSDPSDRLWLDGIVTNPDRPG
ncbi:MAG TPA: DUF4287 domain-containing protein [Propionicimonas sp.]